MTIIIELFGFLKKILEDLFLFVGVLIPLFLDMVTSALGFKARVDPPLACFVVCVQWIPQIHLPCDTS